MKPKNTIKNISLIIAMLASMFLLSVPSAFAAKYYFADNANLIKGCSGTIEVKIDTEGANVTAGDTAILIKSNEVKANQLSIGNVLPMQIFSQISDTRINLSGARLPTTGSFKGMGTFGYINFTPNDNANSGTFSFSGDLNTENTIIDENINNVLTDAASKTYTFKDRYNKNVDGIGFCNPDTTPPTVQFIVPPSDSGNNPANTDIIFTITDNRTGVDINSLKFTIGGVNYTKSSGKVTVKQDGGLYRVETNPDKNFAQGDNVLMKVDICDLNVPANCTTANSKFWVYTPTPPPPICGDGIANYQNGEQCDDGNTKSGDGCSSLCLYEIPTAPATREASCNDGLQNQGEEGIDCGGPCSKTCPTCVDGIKNQNEESVDCGGPCPSCGALQATQVQCPVVPEAKFITICHYPQDNPEKPYSLVIPDSEWAFHQAHGDTMGACTVPDACTQALLAAAPEREQQALDQAATVINQGVVQEQKAPVVAPTVLTEVVSQIDICKANPAYATANFDSASADTDADGLSDRVECYAGTDPIKTDTDGDGCTDYEELNDYFTNPLDSDCKVGIKMEAFSDVLITDPQPGWILSTKQPTIRGKVPASTILVLVVATQSEQTYVTNLLKATDDILGLAEDSPAKQIESVLKQYNDELNATKVFLDANGQDFNSEAMKTAVSQAPAELKASDLADKKTKTSLITLKAELTKLKAKPIVATASTQLQDTKVGELDAKNFEEVSNPLLDRQIYDLVATAYLADGSQVNSKAVRFRIDLANTIEKPVPRTIGGELIPSETAFNNIFIDGKAYAQDNTGRIEVEIQEQRPTVTGETEFGSQVFAIWNSVVLASSVISDSEEGAFEVQAPRDLEMGVPHRVTLYAVKSEDNNKIRSESVDVFFRIKTPGAGVLPIAVAAGTLAGLAVLGFVVRRVLQIRSTMKLFKSKK